MGKVYVDMDGVIADFYNSPMLNGEKRGYGNYPEMYEEGFFESLPVIAGSLGHIRKIIRDGHDVWILTQPVKETAHSYSEKVRWIMKWFPELVGKIVMTQEKGALCEKGDVLIDDNEIKWEKKWAEKGGVFIHFDERNSPATNWQHVMWHLNKIKAGKQ